MCDTSLLYDLCVLYSRGACLIRSITIGDNHLGIVVNRKPLRCGQGSTVTYGYENPWAGDVVGTALVSSTYLFYIRNLSGTVSGSWWS